MQFDEFTVEAGGAKCYTCRIVRLKVLEEGGTSVCWHKSYIRIIASEGVRLDRLRSGVVHLVLELSAAMERNCRSFLLYGRFKLRKP